MFENVDWMYHYYMSNNLWVYGNVVLIAPFIIACVFRFFNTDIKKKLWTDELARIFLILTCAYYIYDTPVKYFVDGGDTICLKAFYIHHISSLFIIPPIIFNSYIPWFANPIGFLHGFCIFFPEFEPLNYVYASALMFFHFMIYQKPYADLRGYEFTIWAINGVWVFCLMLLIGDCSNYLPLGPD